MYSDLAAALRAPTRHRFVTQASTYTRQQIHYLRRVRAIITYTDEDIFNPTLLMQLNKRRFLFRVVMPREIDERRDEYDLRMYYGCNMRYHGFRTALRLQRYPNAHRNLIATAYYQGSSRAAAPTVDSLWSRSGAHHLGPPYVERRQHRHREELHAV